jgi:hypothetical protein
MISACPENREWLRLLDGEATENHAAELRAHAELCPRCTRELDLQRRLLADLAAPVANHPDAVQVVLQRLDAAPTPPRRLPWRGVGVAAGVLAAAAAVALFAIPGSKDAGTFVSRGEKATWTHRVGVELWALEGIPPVPRKLVIQAPFASTTPLLASYFNLDKAPAYLLAFAVDRQGELHWAYPGYEDAKTDPQAVRLEPLQMHRALSESVVLEALPAGPLQLVTILSRRPLHVSQIEALRASERGLDRLRTRFPGTRIDSLTVHVSTPAKEAP